MKGVAAPLGGRGDAVRRQPAGAGPRQCCPPGVGQGDRRLRCAGPRARTDGRRPLLGSSTPACCCCPATARATPGPCRGNRILSQVLNRAFSRYSSLAAHFSRLVSIPRRQLGLALEQPQGEPPDHAQVRRGMIAVAPGIRPRGSSRPTASAGCSRSPNGPAPPRRTPRADRSTAQDVVAGPPGCRGPANRSAPRSPSPRRSGPATAPPDRPLRGRRRPHTSASPGGRGPSRRSGARR